MMLNWANEFREVLSILPERPDLRERMVGLLAQDTWGKVTEGGDRLSRFRHIMADIIKGELTWAGAFHELAHQLPRNESKYAASNHVFCSNWEERLLRTQLSRFYNQAVLEYLVAAGESVCFIPHSSEEDAGSRCTLLLAGANHEVAPLLARLVETYTHGKRSPEVKIPEHPHCTHVVRPVQQ